MRAVRDAETIFNSPRSAAPQADVESPGSASGLRGLAGPGAAGVALGIASFPNPLALHLCLLPRFWGSNPLSWVGKNLEDGA